MLCYRHINSQLSTDNSFAITKGKSVRGNTCDQIFLSEKGFVAIYTMQSKGDSQDVLQNLCKYIGAPISLVLDPSGEQTYNQVGQFCHQVRATLRVLVESTQWVKRAELFIKKFKELIRKDIRYINCPKILRDYCAVRLSTS